MLRSAVPMILLNKPHQVLSQFRDETGRRTLAELIDVAEVYPAGRLDYDSEGLILLTDDGQLQARVSEPKHKIAKAYWAQVEGTATEKQSGMLQDGLKLKDGVARAVAALLIDEPANLWPRIPPIRERKSIPTSWLDITIAEGRNRQVRRMSAAAGLPTLRLIRHRIGPWGIDALLPGQSREINNKDAWRELNAYLRSTLD
jgi:23S rRNA pseudouridine2457 synthase